MKDRKPASNRIIDMFNRVAGKYDFLNHVLSLGQDIFWRKKVIKFVPAQHNLKIIDLATGTADQLITMVKNCTNIHIAIGIDIAENMLKIAKKKLLRLNLNNKIFLSRGDISKLHIADNSTDMITISFGIRNIPNFQDTLHEIRRILKLQGTLLILEFSIPENIVIQRIYLFYFRKIMPKIGAFISGDKNAYNYLNQSVEKFPYGNHFILFLKNAGFGNIKTKSLTFGIATIYCAQKMNNI